MVVDILVEMLCTDPVALRPLALQVAVEVTAAPTACVVRQQGSAQSSGRKVRLVSDAGHKCLPKKTFARYR